MGEVMEGGCVRRVRLWRVRCGILESFWVGVLGGVVSVGVGGGGGVLFSVLFPLDDEEGVEEVDDDGAGDGDGGRYGKEIIADCKLVLWVAGRGYK